MTKSIIRMRIQEESAALCFKTFDGGWIYPEIMAAELDKDFVFNHIDGNGGAHATFGSITLLLVACFWKVVFKFFCRSHKKGGMIDRVDVISLQEGLDCKSLISLAKDVK